MKRVSSSRRCRRGQSGTTCSLDSRTYMMDFVASDLVSTGGSVRLQISCHRVLTSLLSIYIKYGAWKDRGALSPSGSRLIRGNVLQEKD
jgi:hypothetical protein